MALPVRMASTTPSYESLLQHFRARQGLFILGAGASAGEVRLGPDFLASPAIDYVRGNSFPVSIPAPSELTQKIISLAQAVPLSRVFPNRIIRPGFDEFPYQELLRRMPSSFARFNLKHDLSKVRFIQRSRDAYAAFRFFSPAVMLNYNLDGLATEHCGDIHQVITPHGTVPKAYGSPDAARLLAGIREYDLRLTPDGLVISVPESSDDEHLKRCLDMMAACSPHFIAIVGYTFGRNGKQHDDWISLDRFRTAFHRFAGNVYVIEPSPTPLRELIADGIASNRVFAVPAYWNILAHIFAETVRGRLNAKSMSYACQQILDRHGDKMIFPLIHKDV